MEMLGSGRGGLHCRPVVWHRSEGLAAFLRRMPVVMYRHVGPTRSESPKRRSAYGQVAADLPSRQQRDIGISRAVTVHASSQPLFAQQEGIMVGSAPTGSTVEFCFYFTRALDGPPPTDGNPALRHIVSLGLRDGRWLVAFVWLRSLSAADIAAARDAAVDQARVAGVQVRAEHRLALFALPTAETSAAVLEVCATDA